MNSHIYPWDRRLVFEVLLPGINTPEMATEHFQYPYQNLTWFLIPIRNVRNIFEQVK